MNEKTTKSWQDFLRPVVLGLCALMSAAAVYLQRSESAVSDSRLTAVEVEVKNIQSWRGKADGLLYEIRSDVSFIRGKMEGGSNGAWRF